jgi:hypothetical protein
MRKNVKERAPVKVQVKVQEKEKCHHFWVIDVANGPSSLGKCKICGEKKEFMNAFPTFNPLRKNSNPLNLPKMPNVEMEKESES